MYGKLLIQCELTVRTGMHIGGSAAFSAIGAVDSPVVRDPFTGHPIIPGSSLKGKVRTLLARTKSPNAEKMPSPDEDAEEILRLFGAAQPPRRSRLQFSDCFVSNYEQMQNVGLTEVKAENTIDRATSVANPRQIERVTAGTQFGVHIVYDMVDLAQAKEDLALLAKGLKLLQLDYLGGHGSRGSGRVALHGFKLSGIGISNTDISALLPLFNEVENYEPLSV